MSGHFAEWAYQLQEFPGRVFSIPYVLSCILHNTDMLKFSFSVVSLYQLLLSSCSSKTSSVTLEVGEMDTLVLFLNGV